MGKSFFMIRLFVTAVSFVLVNLNLVLGIRFVLHKEECFSQLVEYDNDTVRTSFVVITTNSSWDNTDYGVVDYVVKDPFGEQIHDVQDQEESKHKFVAHKGGLYRFCFYNKSPYNQKIDFDVHVGHITEPAKNDHVDPLMIQVAKLEESLYTIQFEQHWLEAHAERQSILNEKMSRRIFYKALSETVAVAFVSCIQIFILQRFFEKKLSTTIV